jgi:hypothetical protein
MRKIEKMSLILLSVFLTCYALSTLSVCIAQPAEKSYKSIPAPNYSLLHPFKREKMPAAVHWSASLKPGEFKTINGIILEREPAGKRPLMIAGLTAQPPQNLLEDLRKIKQLNPTQRANTYNSLANWAASYYGRDLPSGKQRQLTKLYLRYSQDTVKISSKEALDSKSRQQLIENQAKLITNLLIEERDLFLGDPKAQLRRYGKVVVRPKSIKPDRKIIKRDIIYFLSGEYLKDEQDKLNKERNDDPRKMSTKKIQYVRVPSWRLGYASIKEKQQTTEGWVAPLLVDGKCSKVGSETSTQLVEGPVSIGVEERIFVSEHPITGSTWEQMGLPDFYHTSIVAGKWIIKKTVEEVKTTTCQALEVYPAIANRRQAVYMNEFDGWIIANGCAGTYRSDDELREVARFYWEGEDSPNQLSKHIYGTTADNKGERCRARYGAYPMGFYGVNWVCHQNCNAFAYVKWNILPVFFFVSAGFGLLGNLDIADVNAPCECLDTSENHCCVPGNDCCWATAYGVGGGWGHLLSGGWHSEMGWIGTECKFAENPVDINGWDEGPEAVPIN